jgi:hypothetical protein
MMLFRPALLHDHFSSLIFFPDARRANLRRQHTFVHGKNHSAGWSAASVKTNTVSVSVMRLNGLGDHEVESPARQMSFKVPLAVVIVDRNNAVAKATVETNGALGAVVGPPL